MIPIKNLIRDGGWLKCSVNYPGSECPHTLQFRILRFEKVDYGEVDRPERAEEIEEGAVRWLMELEVVNISKTYASAGELTGSLRVVDGDGFIFKQDNDSHLCCFSEFAKRSGLKRLYGGNLMPKIRVRGAMLFRVPDEDTEYALAIDKGTLEEV
jgi:hypothetical protein